MSPALAVRVIVLTLGSLSVVAHWLIPRFTRPDLYFAVTVAPGFPDSAEGRSILRRYRVELIAVSVPALALLGALVLTSALPVAPIGLLVQLGGYFAVYYRARHRVLPHAVAPTTVREARLSRPNRQIPGGWALAAGPFALLAACAGYLAAHWQRLPAQWVIHWGIHGQPDRWAERSLGTVFFPLILATVILLALTLLLYGMAHWLRPIHAGGLEGEHESRYRRTASILLIVLEYWIAALCCWLALRLVLPEWLQRPPTVFALVPGLIAVVATAVLMWLGQGGSRISPGQSTAFTSSKPVGDRTGDRFWTLGIFYFNRDDPSVLVEKRFGIGYTVNFAHPIAWAIVLLPVLTVIAVAARIVVRHLMR